MSRQHAAAITVCLACAASVAGHWWIARQSERRLEWLLSRSHEFVPVGGTYDVPSLDEIKAMLPDEITSSTRPPRLLSAASYESTPLNDEPADASQPSHPDANSKPAESARPLSRKEREDQEAVRAVIEEEMPETGHEERDIWFEELKSLPAEVVRDLLQVRKQLRVLSPDHAFSGPAQLPHHSVPHISTDERAIAAEPVKQSKLLRSGDWTETRSAMEQAIAWSTHNLANAATPGYKRIEVILGDAYASTGNGVGQPRSMPAIGHGCGLQALRLDMTPGKIKATNRNLDLAIEGEGFLILSDPSFGFRYTRCGAATLDGQGQLCLAAGEQFIRLEPLITIPFDARAVTIAADGKVTYRADDQDEPHEAGQLKLAKFPDPSRLLPVGNGLYDAPPEYAAREIFPLCGPPGSLDRGVLRQGFLEQSNVDLKREQADREVWESILRTLSASDIPRTAREGSRSPK